MRSVLGALVALALVTGAGTAAAATLYVSNTRSDSISVIDTETFEVLDTIPLGRGKSNRIAFHPDGRTAWVVFDKSRDLGVVDAETRTLLRRVKIGGNPYNLTFTPDGRHLVVLDWASETSTDEVIFYDVAAGRIEGRVEVSTWPAHAVVSRDGTRLYVSGETAGDLTVIDVATRTIVARVVHGGGDAMGLALSPDGKVLYAAAGENRTIVKVDPATHQPVKTIALPGIVRGRHAFVTNRYADLVTVIDVTTHKQVHAIPVGKAPHGMALRPR